jgi:hypothetical protein
MQKTPIKIRWSELRLLGICAVSFGLAIGLLTPGVWPLEPFPAVAPVEIAALLGFLYGFVTRRAWVLLLPLTGLIALNPPQSGIAGALIGTLVIWPFAAAGGAIGMGLGKLLQRRMLRRTLKAAGRRERAARPPATTLRPQPALASSQRRERVSVAGR